MAWAMMRQLPKFFATIRREHALTEAIVKERSIDIVVSDNRYGVCSSRAHSVVITHQSNIMMPRRFGMLRGVVNAMNHRLLRNFTTCWIPDLPGGDALAGELGSFHKVPHGLRVEYIGWLSRFLPIEHLGEKRYDVLAILSGPEPQRSLFEKAVSQQLAHSNLRYLIVRGVPGSDAAGNGHVVNFLKADDLQRVMASSEVVVARSGYSTVMDLLTMRQNAILVPTPGQPEQEYLSKRLKEKGIFFSTSQKEFQLDVALREYRKYGNFTGLTPVDMTYLETAVEKLLNDT